MYSMQNALVDQDETKRICHRHRSGEALLVSLLFIFEINGWLEMWFGQCLVWVSYKS